jgi:hypothetical protein
VSPAWALPVGSLAGAKIKFRAACWLLHRDVNAAACSVVSGVSQHRQVLQVWPQGGEHVLAGGCDVEGAAGVTGEVRSGMPQGVNSAWMLPPKGWVLPEYHRSISPPRRLVVFSSRRSAATTLPSRIRYGSPYSFARPQRLARARRPGRSTSITSAR